MESNTFGLLELNGLNCMQPDMERYRGREGVCVWGESRWMLCSVAAGEEASCVMKMDQVCNTGSQDRRAAEKTCLIAFFSL